MPKRACLTSVFLVFIMCLFCTHAFADSADRGGLDMRIGLAADVLRVVPTVTASGWGMSYSDSGDAVNFDGLMGQISIGIRWSMGGIYLTQDLGGVWLNEDNEEYQNGIKKGRFLGGTFVVGRFIIPATSNFQIDLGAGLGLMYGHGQKPISGANYTPSLIYNENGDPSVAFAIKVGISMLYYITPAIGLGVFCDYNYAFKTFNDSSEGFNLKTTINYHNVNPGIQFMLKI